MSVIGTAFAKRLWSGKVVEEVAKTTNTIANYAGTFIDKMFHTKQEKSEASLMVLEFNLRAAELAQKYNPDGKSLSRRVIAFGFTGSFLLALWIGSMLECFEIGQADIFFLMADKLALPTQIILYFYFGYYAVKQVGTGILEAFVWLRKMREAKKSPPPPDVEIKE